MEPVLLSDLELLSLLMGEKTAERFDPKSTAPRGQRKRKVLPEIETFIILERLAHSRLGKEKLAVLLKEKGYPVSESYVSRIIGDLKQGNLLSSGKKLSFQQNINQLGEL